MKVLKSVTLKVLMTLGTLALLSMLIFWAMNYKSAHAVAQAALGRSATPAQLHDYAVQYHLTDSLPSRYLRWVKDALTGNLGVSPVTGRSVASQIGPELVHTFTLAAIGVLISIPIAIALGSFTARRKGKRIDSGILMFTVGIAALPEFVVGLLIIYVFAVSLGWLPIESQTAFSFGTGSQKVEAFVLPVATVCVAIVPSVYRFVRGAVDRGLRAEYTEAAELRGLAKRTVFWDFVLRNSAAPIINAAALNIAYAISGLVAIETVFSFPGVGQNLVAAIGQGDTVTVQAIALIMALLILIVFLLADVLTAALDPRLRLRR